MDPRMNSREEYNRDESGRKRDNAPGVYYHPQAERFVETGGVKRQDGTMAYDQAVGKIQADAFVQLGFRLATEEEAKRYRALQAKQAAPTAVTATEAEKSAKA